ncbi:hypothetical protein Tco_0357594 [Tanacetum coccineum]
MMSQPRKLKKNIRWRKGMHTSVDKNDSEDSDEVGEHEESTTGTETPINLVPVAMKTPSVATYKIIKQGEKGVYQIVREDGTDIVYINFGAMLKSISRDDLTELYRIVMNRYGMDGPEDKLEKGFWKCLRIMVHCLNLESLDVYMLSERKYPLSAEVCQTMLKMKLLDGKMNEDCYRLLKMMENSPCLTNIRTASQEQMALGAKGLTSPEQTATVKGFQLTWTLHLSGAKGYYSRVMANCKEDQSIHLKFSMIHLHRIIPPGSDEK